MSQRYASAYALLLVSLSLSAADKWSPPQTIRQYCAQLEADILSTHKTMIEVNNELLAESRKSPRDLQLLQEKSHNSDLFKTTRNEYEEEWARLDCAYILYPKPAK